MIIQRLDAARRFGRAPRPASLVLVFVAVCVLLASDGSAQESTPASVAAKSDVPPKLSLESLYHPEQKFDYDQQLPKTHWIEGPPSELLLLRGKAWNRVDLATKSESPWPPAATLQSELEALDGVTGEEAAAAIKLAVPKLHSGSQAGLFRVGKSLAIASPATNARWLTRDATGWKDATLDPTARRVAYTRDGDLFVIDTSSGRQQQLTNDGSETLLDGLLDWTYQEEIFGRGNFRGFWFSHDGNWLAMLRIDISGIEPYTLSSASGPRGTGLVSRYPKAGDPIPHATLLVWDLRNLMHGDVPPARTITQSDAQQQRIITGVWWNPHHQSLVFCVTDRTQTWRELRRISLKSLADGISKSTLLLREESPSWVEPPAEPGWLTDGSLIWRSELPTGRTRLYHISINGQSVTPLTPADFDVREFSLSPANDFVLVTGDAEQISVNQQIYRVDLNVPNSAAPASPAERPRGRLTQMTKQPGWHTATLSPDGKWFIDVHSSAARPPALSVRSTSTDSGEAAKAITLEQTKLLAQQRIIEPEFLRIPTADGPTLPAIVIRPNGSGSKRVPVVVEVYGGPQAPKVVNRWGGQRTLYRELLAREGIATLVVDNRSSAGRGLADTWPIRGRVGEIEFQDLMTAVDWLSRQSWVDQERIAIRGWSFGGFMTLYAMTHSDAFVAGIAGGSVTDWREYDAFYTERYMGLPGENAEGYKKTAPLNHAADLHGEVLLIHGEADDNVHPSGTLRMAKALQDAGKDFRLMIYPGAAHSVRDPKQLWHLSRMTHRFLREKLQREPESGPK